MRGLSKTMFTVAMTAALTGTAFAQAEDEAGEGEAAPAAEPAAAPEAAPASEPMGATAAKQKLLGLDAAFVLPLSDYGDSADFAVGPLLRFEMGVAPNIAVTARAGVLFHVGTPEGFGLTMIPIYVGGKYNIGTSGLFAAAEVGATVIRASVDIGGISASETETKFGFTAGLGYQKSKIQVRANLFVPDVGEIGDALGVMASVGYDFLAL